MEIWIYITITPQFDLKLNNKAQMLNNYPELKNSNYKLIMLSWADSDIDTGTYKQAHSQHAKITPEEKIKSAETKSITVCPWSGWQHAWAVPALIDARNASASAARTGSRGWTGCVLASRRTSPRTTPDRLRPAAPRTSPPLPANHQNMIIQLIQ